MTTEFWRGRRVLVTGHTGFKGSWLSLWLDALGAKVTGIALAPLEPSLFTLANVEAVVDHHTVDINHLDAMQAVFERSAPDLVFHLAAQSLVRYSYRYPIETLATNVLGTAHVLEACRLTPSVKAVVIATSDKCYDNHDSTRGHREGDPMGGDDPYSASKGCAELVTHAWRTSFFAGRSVASVRAGNVFGGGDWAADRLVPDLIRGFAAATPVSIRSPSAVRPWQHVLDPLRGYLLLAERLFSDSAAFAEGWNFGPDPESVVPVSDIADRLVALWGGEAGWRTVVDGAAPKEAAVLQLDSSKVRQRLGWRPVWSLAQGLAATVSWYKAHAAGQDIDVLSRQQIAAYTGDMAAMSAGAS